MTPRSDITELIADVREQVLYLQELGVDSLDADTAMLSVTSGELYIEKKESPTFTSPPIIADPIPDNFKFEISNKKEQRPAVSRLASLPSLSSLNKRAASAPEAPVFEMPENKTIEMTAVKTFPEPTETIEQIRAEIGPDCTRCKLSTLGRSKVVNSTGNFNADLMFVGEAPGADEDEQGFPFVGRAGRLLTDIMMAIGFNREDVFIGNINRCRPPANRAPEPDETIACKPFLKREIAVVRPKVIVVLGATAAQNLLETKVPIGKLRGHFHDYLGTKVMPTFHPAYLLRDPHKKREVWEDMKLVRDYLNSMK